LRRHGTNGIQTPTRIVNGVISGTPRMHHDGRFSTSSGRARFIPASWPWPSYAAQVAEQRKNFRFWINNGRTNHIWQTNYHHQRIPFYNDHNPLPYVEMHADDAESLGIASGDLVELFNNVGTVRAMATITDAVKPGHTFMMFGHPRGSVGNLSSDHVDPKTTIPYYKGAWADIRRIGPKPDVAKNVSFLPQNVSE
jgi:arsenite oxidase large subunit